MVATLGLKELTDLKEGVDDRGATVPVEDGDHEAVALVAGDVAEGRVAKGWGGRPHGDVAIHYDSISSTVT